MKIFHTILFLMFVMCTLLLFFTNFQMFTLLKIFYFKIELNNNNLMFLCAVTFISIMIFVYSNYYMKYEKNYTRFFYLLLMFVCSMLMLILIENLFLLYFAWDGLGITSYCLISFYMNNKSTQSSMITMLSNRFGDVIFLVILVLYFFFMNFSSIQQNLSKTIVFMIVLLASTKSAIFMFSSWLLFAMAAPTPVSSLVHSSTLVTAGVYILIKFFPVLNIKNFSLFMIFISISTMIYSGMMALYEMDMKKIIALSTLSQMSFMFLSLSLNLYVYSYFHMLSHAFFKSLLFTIFGIFIHLNFSQQDTRIFLKGKMIYKLLMMVSLLSLMGLIFLSGFFSKDLILEKIIFMKGSFMMLVLIYLVMFLSMFYSFKFLKSQFKSSNIMQYFFWENSYTQNSILLLAIMSIVFSYFFNWNFLKNEVIFTSLTWKSLLLFIIIFSLILFNNYKDSFYFINFISKMFFLNNITLMVQMIFSNLKYIFKIFFEKSFLEMLENKIIINNMVMLFNNIISSSYFLNISILFLMVMMMLWV